jgi:hypothetical protein
MGCNNYEDQGQLEYITEKTSETLAVYKETKIISILICLIFPSGKHPLAIYIKHAFFTVYFHASTIKSAFLYQTSDGKYLLLSFSDKC